MPEVAKPNRKIAVHELPAAEYQRNLWVAKPEHGTTLDEMRSPEYWANVATSLRAWDRIEVRPADGTWFAELIVRAVQPFAANVAVLPGYPLEFVRKDAPAAREIVVPPGYELKHRGPNGWAIIRQSDKAILTEKLQQPLQTRDEAVLWLERHLKALA